MAENAYLDGVVTKAQTEAETILKQYAENSEQESRVREVLELAIQFRIEEYLGDSKRKEETTKLFLEKFDKLIADGFSLGLLASYVRNITKIIA